MNRYVALIVGLSAALGLVCVGGGRDEAALADEAKSGPDKEIPAVNIPGHGRLLVAGPFAHKNLAVFMLYRSKPAADLDYITLEEGMNAGLVTITESASAQVRRLLVTNKSERPLFLVAGELIRGGKQDRTLQMSMVIPPKTTEAPLPSFCVEASRWTGGGKFAGQGAIAGNANQAAIVAEDQGEVWKSVASYKRSLRVNVAEVSGRPVKASRTTSMNEELNDKDVKDLMNGYVKAVGGKHRHLPRPLGLAYAVDGRMTALHVFNSSLLFRKLSTKLVKASAMDAVAGKIDVAPPSPTVKDLANFIAAAWDGKKSSVKPGLGNLVVRYLASTTFTSELYFKEVLVHSQVGRIDKPIRPQPLPQPRNRDPRNLPQRSSRVPPE